MNNQTVQTSAGAAEYTWPVTLTETTGKNISSDSVLISLGSYSEPGAWQTPDVLTRPTPSTATAQMLVDSRVAAGTYWLWLKVTDSPEVVPRRAQKLMVT